MEEHKRIFKQNSDLICYWEIKLNIMEMVVLPKFIYRTNFFGEWGW